MSTQVRRRKARELTDEERKVWAKWAYDVEQRIKKAIAKGRSALWELAEAVTEFEEDDGWKALGYEKKTHWLADPDISMTSGTYYRLREAWREMAGVRKLPMSTLRDLDLSKVAVVLSAPDADVVLTEDIIDDVDSMGWRDLREKYLGAAPKNPSAGVSGSAHTDEEGDTNATLRQSPGPQEGTADQVGEPNLAKDGDSPVGQVHIHVHESSDETLAEAEAQVISGVLSPSTEPEEAQVLGNQSAPEAPEAPAHAARDNETEDSVDWEEAFWGLRDAVVEFVGFARESPRSRKLPERVEALAVKAGIGPADEVLP